MLRPEENERLTRVGPGTPMGELLRRYWHPIAVSGELVDNPVKPVRILGENLTLYRDRSGGLGLIGQRCAHRLVDLRCGIPTQDGLKCPYHGWAYDATGQCTDQPAEAPDSTFYEKVKLDSYPVRELGGLVWTYMGPDPAPLIPRWFPFVADNAFRHVGTTTIPCNWLQCQENSMDSVHTEYLHGQLWEYVRERKGDADPVKQGEINRFLRHHQQVRFEAFEYGFRKYRLVEGDAESANGWSIGNPLIFPYMVLIGSPGRYELQIRVPVDDVTTWHLSYQVFLPGEWYDVPVQASVPSFNVPIEDLPDYVLGQDILAWPLQGEIVDRSQERLGESDRGIILLRRLLMEQIDVALSGRDPMNVFRDPERNECIQLPIPDYVGPRGYRRGMLVAVTTGTHCPWLDDVDKMMMRAADAQQQAEANGRARPTTASTS
ncbi:MAG: Rieske 2Fe-2S domain-containing protein [Mycobacterium sp.]|nr:Rieske 2Fe-2S domain-containing protein [Mycobacterium sp.]